VAKPKKVQRIKKGYRRQNKDEPAPEFTYAGKDRSDENFTESFMGKL